MELNEAQKLELKAATINITLNTISTLTMVINTGDIGQSIKDKASEKLLDLIEKTDFKLQ